jgi:hypothetical protein
MLVIAFAEERIKSHVTSVWLLLACPVTEHASEGGIDMGARRIISRSLEQLGLCLDTEDSSFEGELVVHGGWNIVETKRTNTKE